ncbi:SDR family oxidoreductase [Paracoccaceae bacterium]|nr:SDR family oxidoreductase [Paracoccaceae bacterium]
MKDQNILLVGSEGLIGDALKRGLNNEAINVISADIKFSFDKEDKRNFNINITSEKSVERVFSKVNNINSVVICAYPKTPMLGATLDKVSYQDFCENISLHLGGFFNIMKIAGFYLKSRGGGSIVSLSSIYSKKVPNFSIYEGTNMTMPIQYAAAKAGIDQISTYFAKYFLKYNVRYNTVNPGGVFDNQDDLFVKKYSELCGHTGLLSPEDLIGIIKLLIDEKNSFITGQSFFIDDGFSLK